MIDHEKRIGGPYGKRTPCSEASKQLMSQKMKAWNRKHGNALTVRGNRQSGFGAKKARAK